MSDLDFRATTKAIRAQRQQAGGAKALSVSLAPGGFVTEIQGYGRLGSPRADTATLQGTMARNELCYACIAIKATAARDPRLTVQIQRRSGGKLVYAEEPGHPFRSLIMRPNDRMTEGDLVRAAIVSWDVSNPRRFYCEKEYKGSLLIGLHPLNPGLMTPRYSRDRRDLIGYDYADGTHRREYALDELLIRSAPAWYDPPPLVAALGATESDTAQTDYVRAFFENGGVPPGLLKYSMPLNDEKRDEIRAKWQSTYGNRHGRQHNIGVLDSNVEFQQTGSKLDELQSQTLRSVAESRICMVFGVPPLIVYAYVGLLRATYSNLGEAWRGFWDATMSPMFKELRDFWTWSLLTEFEDERDIRSEKVRLAYDMSAVAALQEDVDAIQKRSEAAWRAGGMTRAEYRQALGQSADPSDAFYLLPAGAQIVPVGSMPAPAAPIPPKATAGRKDRQRASVQLTERRMEHAVQSYLAGQYEAAAQAVSA